MVEYLSTTPKTAPLITTSYCLGLISTQRANKEQIIIVLKKNQLCFEDLLFKENSDQKVTISRILDGNSTVTNVSMTRLGISLAYNLGVGMTAYLLESNVLGIQSIQCVYEYKVVRVGNEIVERTKERTSTTEVDDNIDQFEVGEVKWQKNGI